MILLEFKMKDEKQGVALVDGDIKQRESFHHLERENGRFFKAPVGMKGIPIGCKLYVLESGITPAECPLGAGLEYHMLDKGVTLVRMAKEFAWLQHREPHDTAEDDNRKIDTAAIAGLR